MKTVNHTIQDIPSSDIELGPTVNVQDPTAHPYPATPLEQGTSSLAACITACNECHEELQVASQFGYLAKGLFDTKK